MFLCYFESCLKLRVVNALYPKGNMHITTP